MKIVLATANPNKVKEMNAIAANLGLEAEFVLPPEGFEPEENGVTFEENSLIKAREAVRLTGMPALADDSGLCVEALGGAPGIYSARYAPTNQERIDKLLKELEPYPNRRAKFVCAMTLADGQGQILRAAAGECCGQIARESFGTNGFGYDPVFIADETGLTLAQMSEEEKNKISHRARALKAIFS